MRDELLGIEHADEDFLVPGLDQAGLRAALEPHGRVDDMEVHGQLVGVRFHPRDTSVRAAAPSGIELTPPRTRAEHRARPPGLRDRRRPVGLDRGRHGPPRLHRQRDGAGGSRPASSSIRSAAGATSSAGCCARSTRESFAEDPLRILRGLRLVSQLDFALADETLAQMRAEAAGLRHVSAERIGGGQEADGMGELSKLLLGRRPALALRLARDTGALVEVVPEYAAAIGYELDTERQPLPLDEHLFAVVQGAADAERRLAVRLSALLHDLAKPETDRTGGGHARVGAELTGRILRRLRYPNALRDEVCRLVAGHAFDLDGPIDGLFARRFLASNGLELSRELVVHKRADLAAKQVEALGARAPRAARTPRWRLSATRRTGSPTSPSAGTTLIAIGYEEGPELGAALARLLDVVVDEPSANDPERLLELAAAWLLTAAEVRERYLRIRERAGERRHRRRGDEVRPGRGARRSSRRRASRSSARTARRTCSRSTRATATTFRWHFIGHLQSNKAKVVNEICELVHSLDSDSAARKLTVPALLEVNLSGEATKSGVAPDDVGGWLERHPSIRGLMTMPPLADDPEASRPWFAPPRGARRRARPAGAFDGDLAGLGGRGRGGSDADPRRLDPGPLTSAVPHRGYDPA